MQIWQNIYVVLHIWARETMINNNLTNKEKLVLYGLTKYPDIQDYKLAKKLGLKQTTVSSIKRRLKEEKFFRHIRVPLLQDIGCEMLVGIHANFNPIIPLEQRVEIASKNIEIFDEIFFSVGEQEKGFSLSLAKNYTSIGKINDIRTKTFGEMSLLEEDYPHEIIIPFEISKIYRFFDFDRAIKKLFRIDIEDNKTSFVWFEKRKQLLKLSDNEKKVYYALIKYPDLSLIELSKEIGISRHTISKMKKTFIKNNLMKEKNIPNLRKLGFEIISFYHIKFDPKNPPSEKHIKALDTEDTFFLASRKFECLILSVYKNYNDYKIDKMKKIEFLRRENLVCKPPLIRKYIIDRMYVIKDLEFAPIVKKILGI